ncbi:MAG TPA: rRNA maturation RNase YbeY [Myxococcota bacterium]|nr:rRNA maturation RNase YbeY [Myxococcota bacterium]
MTVRLHGRRGGLDRRRLRQRAARVLRELDCTRAELSIALVDDETIADLNARYRGVARATDVLAFSLLDGAHAEHRGALLGDVVVSLDTAAVQARRARRTLDDEVLRLLIHGTLHLLGHDHERAAEARRMRAEERRVWKALQAGEARAQRAAGE